MAKKRKCDYIRIRVNDELPRIGSGVRWVRIVKMGWKWVHLADRLDRKQRLRRGVWDKLEEGA